MDHYSVDYPGVTKDRLNQLLNEVPMQAYLEILQLSTPLTHHDWVTTTLSNQVYQMGYSQNELGAAVVVGLHKMQA